MRDVFEKLVEDHGEPDAERAWELARVAWQDYGIVCVNPDTVNRRKGWLLQRIAMQLGEQCFGKRGRTG